MKPAIIPDAINMKRDMYESPPWRPEMRIPFEKKRRIRDLQKSHGAVVPTVAPSDAHTF